LIVPWFGIGEALLASVLAWRYRSPDLAIGVAAICGTMLLRATEIEFAPAASAIWALAGAFLITRGKYLAGSLYAGSGLVYILIQIGFQDGRYALVHFLSDAFMLFAFYLLVRGQGGIVRRGFGRRGGYRFALAAARENLARRARVFWGEA
jgi:hypothetical protein